MEPMTQKPEFSTICLVAALEAVEVGAAVVLLSVPFGSVPLMIRVFVPLTSPICTNVLSSSLALPFPIIESKNVELLLSSQPQALYCAHRHCMGKLSF